MRPHPSLTSPAVVIGTVSMAFAASALAGGLGVGALGVAFAAVAILSLLFVINAAEGLTAFAIAMLLSGTVEHWTGLDLRFMDEVAIPMLVVAAIVAHRRRLELPRPGPREGGLALLFAAGIGSSLVNGVPVAIWVPGLGLLAKGFVFFFLVASLRIDAAELGRIVRTVFVIGLAITIVGFVQFVDPSFADDVLRLPSSGRQRGSIDVIGSVFTHPALYGWLTAFMSLFLYARFAVLRAGWALIVAVLLNGGTLISGRRTPIAGVIAGLVVGAARQVSSGRAVGRAWAVVAGAILVILVASIPILGDFYRTTLDRYGTPTEVIGEVFAPDPDPEVIRTLQPRVALYAGSVAVARDRFPFGAGIGRFGSHMSRETYSPIYEAYGLHRTHGLRERNPAAVTDTFWPMILGETGPLGLLGTLAFLAILGLQLWRAAALDGAPEVRAFTLGALLVFVEALVRSLTSAVFVAPPIAFFVLGAAGLSLAIERHARESTA